MVNPGAFRGLRKEFLLSEKDNYAAGMEGGYGADALAQIQRRYFKRFPVDLPHFEDPSPEHLASVNDDTPDPEPQEPDPKKMSAEEYEAAKKASDHRREVVRYRKAQIKRWLAYQYMKDQDLDPKESGANNPFHSLIFSITGKEAGRPRRKTAVNVWRKSQRHEIEAKVRGMAERDNVEKDRLAALRDQIAREMFNKLSAAEQEHWKQQATIESDYALEQWKRAMLSDPPSTSKDYQIAIQGLVRVAKPFLDFVCKATGWKASFIAGGPEPAQGGKLNIISIHGGTTPGELKLNWGRALRVRYRKDVITCFGDFLKMCYTPEICRSRALPVGEGFAGLVEEECQGEGVDLHSVDLPGAGAEVLTASTTIIPPAPTAATSSSAAATGSRPTAAVRPPTRVATAPAPSAAPGHLRPSHSTALSKTRATLAKTAAPTTTKTPFPFGPGRDGAPYQRVPPVRTQASIVNPAHRPSPRPPATVTQAAASILTPSRRVNASTPNAPIYRTPPAEQSRPSSPQSCEPFSYQFGSPDLLISPVPRPGQHRSPTAPPSSRPAVPRTGQRRSPTDPPSPRPASPFCEPFGVEAPLGVFPSSTVSSGGIESPDIQPVPSPLAAGRQDKTATSSIGEAIRFAEPVGAKQRTEIDLELEGGGGKLPATVGKKGKRGKGSENRRPSEPTRKSSRVVGEKRKEPASAQVKAPQAKKRKSTGNKYGNWIESDSDGEGWHDQDGNPCDPPTPYRKRHLNAL